MSSVRRGGFFESINFWLPREEGTGLIRGEEVELHPK